MTRTVARAAAVLALAAGCVSAGERAPRPGPAPATGAPATGAHATGAHATGALRAAARLAPCPPTPGPAVPRGLPDLTLDCLGSGPAVRLAALRGVPTVVNLWAGWCGPCRAEAPALQRLSDRGRVRVLGVLTKDTERNGLAAARGFGIRYPSVVDEDGRLLARLGLAGLPATVFVRADGTVAGRHVGPALSDAQLAALVRRHLRVGA